MKKSRAAQGSLAGEAVVVRGRSGAGEMRIHPRQKIEGIIAQVSDGARCCKGELADISHSGVRLVSSDGNLDRNAHSLGVLLTGAGKSISMRIKPRWSDNRDGEVRIGATIEEALGSWGSLAIKADEHQRVSPA